MPPGLFQQRGYFRSILRISATDLKTETNIFTPEFFEEKCHIEDSKNVKRILKNVVNTKKVNDDADTGKRTLIMKRPLISHLEWLLDAA
jgi:hypothetical protein